MKLLCLSLLLSAFACVWQRGSTKGNIENVVAFTLTSQAQEQSAEKPQIQSVPLEPTSAASAREMYVSYCAACHGKDGKGHGPAASALKEPPRDLTMLAKNNNGKFPADRVAYVLQFGPEVPAHGTKEMPIWGPLLSSLHGKTTRNAALVQLRVKNLTNYIQSLQSN
jgi:mono/diheme cytochrome c family protein